MTDKTKEIHEKYAKDVQAIQKQAIQAAAYKTLTEPQADPVAEEVRKAVLSLSEKGYLETLAKFTAEAMAVQNTSKSKSSES